MLLESISYNHISYYQNSVGNDKASTVFNEHEIIYSNMKFFFIKYNLSRYYEDDKVHKCNWGNGRQSQWEMFRC